MSCRHDRRVASGGRLRERAGGSPHRKGRDTLLLGRECSTLTSDLNETVNLKQMDPLIIQQVLFDPPFFSPS